MGNASMRGKRRAWASTGALCCALASPWALAGPAEDTALAEKEFARGDLIASIALWKKAADQGYAPAQARMGDILDKSEYDDEAVAWYRKAAAQDNAAGIYGLGFMYSKGEGVAKDLTQAHDLILRAAKMDYAPAIITMMEASRAGGLGMAPNAVEGDQWEARLKVLMPDYLKPAPKVVAKVRGRAKPLEPAKENKDGK
jgi:TPR repeat protein